MSLLTYDAVKATLLDLAAERPDYHYAPHSEDEHTLGACYYAVDKDGVVQPDCIVGHVLFRLDPLLFQRVHQHEIEEGASSITGLVMRGEIGSIDDRTLYLLTDVQRQQDAGVPWGPAVHYAVERTERATGSVPK